MEIDKTSLNDLSIFSSNEELSLFNKINITETVKGKEQLKKNLLNPLSSILKINQIHETIKIIGEKKWIDIIKNGTIMVVEQYYEAKTDPIPSNPTKQSSYLFKLLHKHDFLLIKYSVEHSYNFIKGLKEYSDLFNEDEFPEPLEIVLKIIRENLGSAELNLIDTKRSSKSLSTVEILKLGYFLKYRFKHGMRKLIEMYAKLDAWHSMFKVNEKHDFSFPQFTDDNDPVIIADGLFHPLLKKPVPYKININKNSNFLFLTSANMAGKSTFIKAVGTAVYLAHCGFGVPAKSLKLCLFNGLLSNINITDNVTKGESYFYNEVQRIAATVRKINDGRRWLILIDELFKGTNVQDAMRCSTTVIEGLLKIRSSAFILSTHLYEIAEDLKKYSNIQFKYFETSIKDDNPVFNYILKDGISNDRLGYLILKQSGVVKILNDL